jgi:hypothetical protein
MAMKMRSNKSSSSLIVAALLFAGASGCKKTALLGDSSTDTKSPEAGAEEQGPLTTGQTMGNHLKTALQEEGISSEQSKIIVDAGLAKQGAALMAADDVLRSEVLNFVAGAVQILADSSLNMSKDDLTKVLGVIVKSNAASLSAVAPDASKEDLNAYMQDISSETVGNLERGGFASEDFAGAMEVVVKSSMLAFTEIGMPADGIGDFAMSISKGAMSGLDKNEGFDVAKLGDYCEAISKGSVAAISDLANFDYANLDAIAKGTTSGIMSSASKVEGFSSDSFAEIANQTASGVMKGADRIDNFDTSYFDDLAKASTAGIISGASEVKDLDQSFLDNIAQGASEGLMAGVGKIDGFDPALYADIAKAGSAGVMDGMADFKSMDDAKFESIASASTRGFIEGAGKIENFDSAKLGGIASSAASGLVEGAGAMKQVSKAILDAIATGAASGVMEGAVNVRNLDPALFADLAKAAAEGVISGAQKIEGLAADSFSSLAKAATAGAIQGSSALDPAMQAKIETGVLAGVTSASKDIPGIDTAVILAAATEGAGQGQVLVDAKLACESKPGYVWENSMCAPLPATAGTPIAPALDPYEALKVSCMSASNGGTWDAINKRCILPVTQPTSTTPPKTL